MQTSPLSSQNLSSERKVLIEKHAIISPLNVSIENRILFISLYIPLIIILSIYQLTIGSDVAILLSIAAVSTSVAIPFMFKKWYSIDFLWISYASYSGLMALLIKCLLNQPLDSNLTSQNQTAIYYTIANISACLGYLLSRITSKKNQSIFNIGAITADKKFIDLFSIPLFLIGFLALALHTISVSRNGDGEGFGGFGTFGMIFMIGMALQSARWRQSGSGAKAIITLFGMICALVILAIFSNIKKPLADGITIIILSCLLIKGKKVRIWYAIAAIAPIYFLSSYVAPLIQVMRPQLKTHSFSEIITVAKSTLEKSNYSSSSLNAEADKISKGYTYSFRRYGNFLYPSTVNADRFAMIMPADQVVRKIDQAGSLGFGIFSDVPERYLPGFLIKKDNVASADIIGWKYGIRDQGKISRPVIGLAASSIAFSKNLGPVILPFITIFSLFSIVNLLSGPMQNSPWAIFIISYFIQITGEKEPSAIIGLGSREIPLIFICIVCITTVYKTKIHRTKR